ncbi:MAG: hypothetical protein ACK5OB_00755 [Pirellula sp.]|jgi:hypothetical protein
MDGQRAEARRIPTGVAERISSLILSMKRFVSDCLDRTSFKLTISLEWDELTLTHGNPGQN